MAKNRRSQAASAPKAPAKAKVPAEAKTPAAPKAATEYVCILDSLVYYTDDGATELTRISRGDTVANPAKGEVERLLDREKIAPFGAVAAKGSHLAAALAVRVPVDEDPVLARQRLAAADLADQTGKPPVPVEGAPEPVADTGVEFSPQA